MSRNAAQEKPGAKPCSAIFSLASSALRELTRSRSSNCATELSCRNTKMCRFPECLLMASECLWIAANRSAAALSRGTSADITLVKISGEDRSEEHTSELRHLVISYGGFLLEK